MDKIAPWLWIHHSAGERSIPIRRAMVHGYICCIEYSRSFGLVKAIASEKEIIKSEELKDQGITTIHYDSSLKQLKLYFFVQFVYCCPMATYVPGNDQAKKMIDSG